MPAHRLSRFQIFIGVWNTTGEVLETEAGPAGSLIATDTYRWLPGRHFIVHEVDARFDGAPARSMEVMGYDPTAKRHFARSYDDQGLSELYAVELRGRHWAIRGETLRFSGRFDADGARLSGLWEMTRREGGWQPWIKLELVRA